MRPGTLGLRRAPPGTVDPAAGIVAAMIAVHMIAVGRTWLSPRQH